MTTCHVQASGTIELLFYGELPPARRAEVERHLASCAGCRAALDELREISEALAGRPVVDAPAGGDWAGFMARLEPSLAEARTAAPRRMTGRLAPLLAMAALLALVTIGVVSLVTWRGQLEGIESDTGIASMTPEAAALDPDGDSPVVPTAEAALAAVSEQHLARSKLVVLKLANGDRDGDLSYERRLASSLLDDTRLYRLAAEQRGMSSLARVMEDLELVLLQTSMSESLDADTLTQIQRLIRKRDLVTKMNAVARAGGPSGSRF
jgi:hypothetical protein